MRDAAKIPLLLLFLAAAAVSVWVMLGGDDDAAQVPRAADPGAPARPTPSVQAPLDQPRGVVAAEPTDAARETLVSAGRLAGHDFEHGIEATVIDPAGRPVAGARVFLMEGSISSLYQRAQTMQDGDVFAPLASGETDDDGRFALGVPELLPRDVFELRITTDKYADHKVPNITMPSSGWNEIETVQLEQGSTVRGRVMVAGQGTPIPDAVVHITSADEFSELAPTPGRETGLVVEVDQNGYYACDYAPTGVVTMSATAPRFARNQQRDVTLAADLIEEVNFLLVAGVTIQGTVTDTSGAPVPGARVLATPLLSGRLPVERTRTDTAGRFAFLSLVDSAYQLSALAPGFRRADRKPVQGGPDEIALVLEMHGSALVKVTGSNRLLDSYTVGVKRYLAMEERIGDLPDQAPRVIRRDDLRDGSAVIEDLPAGTYVLEILAPGFARTLSSPFRLSSSGDPANVEVQMAAGGSLEGTVVDRGGKPLVGITVRATDQGGGADITSQITGRATRESVYRASAETDAEGSYRLELLPAASYQLRFTHEDYCRELVEATVLDGQTTPVPAVTLVAGTVVFGTTTVNGVPYTGVRVSIQPQDGDPDTSAGRLVTISDDNGQYAFAQRLPPGRYTIQATLVPNNPIVTRTDYEQSRQTFVVFDGQERVRRNIVLLSR